MSSAGGIPCSSCSQALPAGAQHCPYCGAKQRRSTAPEFDAVPAPVTIADAEPEPADPTQVSPDADTRLAGEPDGLGPSAKTVETGPPIAARFADAAPAAAHNAPTQPSLSNPAVPAQASGATVSAKGRSGTRDLNAQGEDDARERFPAGAQLFGSYRSVSRLGEGGMGSVYLARDDVSGQEVAVKVLPATLSKEPDIRERFVQEAQALAQLDHPAIVPLVTFAREGDDHFLVMKFVRGRSLEQVLEADGALPVDTCRRVFRTALEGLGYAHGRGVIHRDVKPANVLLDDEGRVFLVDFGIAKRDKSARLTQTGMLMGTPQYMSPEQISGHPIDGRSDLYGAGLLLFEMLTGRPPFMGDKTFGVLKQHVEAPVPDPRELRDGEIPRDLLVACEALLRKNPDNRPSTAAEAIELLDNAAEQGTPTFGAAVPQEEPLRPTTPLTTPVEAQVFDYDAALDEHALLARQSSGTRTALFVLLVGVAVIAGGVLFIPDLMKQPPPPPPEPTAPQPDPHAQAYEVLLGQAAKALSEGKPRKALPILDAALAQNPDEPRALIFRSQALLRAGKRRSARKVVEKLEAQEELPAELKEVVRSVREELDRRKKR